MVRYVLKFVFIAKIVFQSPPVNSSFILFSLIIDPHVPIQRQTWQRISQVQNHKTAQQFHKVCTDMGIKLTWLELSKE